MTPTDQAARWLADVRRYDRNGRHMELDPQGHWLHQSEVIAAIARLFAPGDDLVERLQQAFVTCRPMNGSNDLDNAASAISDAIARISALTATVAGLRQAMTDADNDVILAHQARETAEREAATLRDRLARMEGALQRWLHNGCPDCSGDCGSANPPVSCCIVQETRAALTDGGKHEN